MTVFTFYELFRKIKSTIVNILHATSVAKATLATKRDMKNRATMRTLIKCVALRKITTIDDLINFFEYNRTNFKLRIRFYKVIPMIFKNLFNSKRKMFSHDIT